MEAAGLVVGAATRCSRGPRAWGSRGGSVPPRDLLRDLGERQVTCHSQNVGRQKGQTHLVTRKALAA